LPEILRAFRISDRLVTGIGALAGAEGGIAGEVILPVGAPPFKIDTRGKVSPLSSLDRLAFLQVADCDPHEEVIPAQSFCIDAIGPNCWKCAIESQIDHPRCVHLITIDIQNPDLLGLRNATEKSKYATTLPSLEETLFGKEYENVSVAHFVGFYGVNGIGLPGINAKGLAFSKDGTLVGGQVREIIGQDIQVKAIPIRNAVTAASGKPGARCG
ncbi:MAG: hypothetical protein PHE27_08885, partial [Alphaproteobacteria bacterium]|nr:hypothetical protein [Alphaproteobacteria bacterium]